MDRIVVTPEDVSKVLEADVPASTPAPAEKSGIPLWARIGTAVLVLFLPVLAIVTIVLRSVLHSRGTRLRTQWTAWMCTLLIASAFLTTIQVAILLYSYPSGVPISDGSSELDEKDTYPVLPAAQPMSAADLGAELKPMVMLVSPEASVWFHHGPQLSGMLGAAVMLHADKDGYLFATANHVADSKTGVMLSTGNGGWTHAEIVARDTTSDAALLWLKRHEGHADFCQPMAPKEEFRPGETVYVIGHPEGLNFTLSSGMISRIPGDSHIQIDAPVSPGNSGGPVYDSKGNLLAVVVASVDNRVAPNAQNLNFAVRSDTVSQLSSWSFSGNGKAELEHYRDQCLKSAHP